MKKYLSYFLLILFISCDYVSYLKKDESVKDKEQKIASVGSKDLYYRDIQNLLPLSLKTGDSIVYVKGLINSWAKNQILFEKAENNISQKEELRINKLIEDYRQSLYINGYKERLVQQKLDTVVSEEEIEDLYNTNAHNFKLSQDLVKVKYIVMNKKVPGKRKIIKKFKSAKEKDINELETDRINFIDYRLSNENWLTFGEFLTKIPVFREVKKEKVLKISKFIQKEDSLRVYLVTIKDVRLKNAVAPLSQVTSNIKDLIIHKRKIELIREIEKTLLKDAIKNNTFKEYN